MAIICRGHSIQYEAHGILHHLRGEFVTGVTIYIILDVDVAILVPYRSRVLEEVQERLRGSVWDDLVLASGEDLELLSADPGVQKRPQPPLLHRRCGRSRNAPCPE